MSRKRNRPCLSVIGGGGGHLRNGLPEHSGEMVFPRQTNFNIVFVRLGYIYIYIHIYI